MIVIRAGAVDHLEWYFTGHEDFSSYLLPNNKQYAVEVSFKGPSSFEIQGLVLQSTLETLKMGAIRAAKSLKFKGL